MSRIENFEVRACYRKLLDSWVVSIGLAVVLILVLLPLQVPFSDDPGERAMEVGGVILVLGAIVGVVLYLRRVKHHLADHSISLDHEGIWLKHQPRDSSLVRWSQIAQLRERPQLQRLELLDDSGRTLLRINYQLDRFLFLRDLILARAAPKSSKDRCFKRGWLYHSINTVGFAALLGVGFASGSGVGAVLLGSLFTFLFVQDYLRVVCRIEIHKNHLVVGWPLRSRTLQRRDISAIKVDDGAWKGARFFYVEIYLNGTPKPLKLKALKDRTIELRHALKHWRVHAV